MLVVILPARDFKNVAPRFRAQVASLLTRIGIPAPAVAGEEEAMAELSFGPTTHRRNLGCIGQVEIAFSYEHENPRCSSVAKLEDNLSSYIYLASNYQRPCELAKELFAASSAGMRASVHRIH